MVSKSGQATMTPMKIRAGAISAQANQASLSPLARAFNVARAGWAAISAMHPPDAVQSI